MIRSDQSYRHDVLGRDNGRVRGHCDDRIKVPRCQSVGEITEVVGEKGADQCKLCMKGGFDQVGLPVDLNLLLALFDDRTDARWGQYAAQSITASADALDQRALRDEVDRHLAGDHLLLGFGIKPDVTGNGPANQSGVNELTDAASRKRRIVGYNGQIAFTLAHEFVDDTLGSADAHEATDHERRTVRNERNGFGNGNRFHLEPLSTKALFTAAEEAIFDLDQTTSKPERI